MKDVNENAKKENLREQSERKFEEAEFFPDFDLKDLSGIKQKSQDISSKFVLIDFWYKNCGPCLLNMKNIEKIRKAFAPEDLEVIAINTTDSLNNDLKKKVYKFGSTHTWLFEGDTLAKQLNVFAYPATFIYNRVSKKSFTERSVSVKTMWKK